MSPLTPQTLLLFHWSRTCNVENVHSLFLLGSKRGTHVSGQQILSRIRNRCTDSSQTMKRVPVFSSPPRSSRLLLCRAAQVLQKQTPPEKANNINNKLDAVFEHFTKERKRTPQRIGLRRTSTRAAASSSPSSRSAAAAPLPPSSLACVFNHSISAAFTAAQSDEPSTSTQSESGECVPSRSASASNGASTPSSSSRNP